VVEERTRIGDWEGDLIVGRFNRSAIGTLVDRRTGYLRLVHLPDGHSAERLRVALLPVLTDLPDLARQTLTWIRTRRWPAITCSRSTWPTASSSHRRPGPWIEHYNTRRRHSALGGLPPISRLAPT
jgi:transposase InsO family protein